MTTEIRGFAQAQAAYDRQEPPERVRIDDPVCGTCHRRWTEHYFVTVDGDEVEFCEPFNVRDFDVFEEAEEDDEPDPDRLRDQRYDR